MGNFEKKEWKRAKKRWKRLGHHQAEKLLEAKRNQLKKIQRSIDDAQDYAERLKIQKSEPKLKLCLKKQRTVEFKTKTPQRLNIRKQITLQEAENQIKQMNQKGFGILESSGYEKTQDQIKAWRNKIDNIYLKFSLTKGYNKIYRKSFEKTKKNNEKFNLQTNSMNYDKLDDHFLNQKVGSQIHHGILTTPIITRTLNASNTSNPFKLSLKEKIKSKKIIENQLANKNNFFKKDKKSKLLKRLLKVQKFEKARRMDCYISMHNQVEVQ